MENKIPTYWFVMLSYLIISFLAFVFVSFDKEVFMSILTNRIVFIVLFVIVFFMKNKLKPKLFQMISLLMIYAFLGGVYKETAILNTIFFEKQDVLVSHWDNLIFGFQPAIEFSKQFNSAFFSEMMFMGYFSYYIIPLVIILSLYNSGKVNHFGFVFITSFVIYYTLFILFPVEGPQFYYTEPNNQIEAQGFFGKAIKIIQGFGEAPTAAFPSSHIGITTIILLWLSKYKRKLLYYILPFSILLFFSTVYIKAHYGVDVLAGFLSGMILYIGVNKIYISGVNKDGYVYKN